MLHYQVVRTSPDGATLSNKMNNTVHYRHVGHALALMCAKNHLLIFSSFLDIWENVEWPRFFGPPCMSALTVLAARTVQQWISESETFTSWCGIQRRIPRHVTIELHLQPSSKWRHKMMMMMMQAFLSTLLLHWSREPSPFAIFVWTFSKHLSRH